MLARHKRFQRGIQRAGTCVRLRSTATLLREDFVGVIARVEFKGFRRKEYTRFFTRAPVDGVAACGDVFDVRSFRVARSRRRKIAFRAGCDYGVFRRKVVGRERRDAGNGERRRSRYNTFE